MCNHIPFTYLIGWTSHSIFYYGVRYAKGCHPDDLWTSYFTSSKYVNVFVEMHGDPDIIEIRKTFNNSESARLWESEVLTRLDVVNNNLWLNRHNAMSPPAMYGNNNPSKRPEVRQKRSDSLKKYWNSDKSENQRNETSSRMKNKNPTDSQEVRNIISEKAIIRWENKDRLEEQSNRFKMCNPNYIPGVQEKISIKRDAYWTEENKSKRSQKYTGEGNPAYGKKQKRVICEYCGKDVAISMYGRWHGNKCKFRKE